MIFCCFKVEDRPVPLTNSLSKWLQAQQSPPDELFKSKMEDVLRTMWVLGSDDQFNEGFIKIEKKVAPIEFVFIGTTNESYPIHFLITFKVSSSMCSKTRVVKLKDEQFIFFGAQSAPPSRMSKTTMRLPGCVGNLLTNSGIIQRDGCRSNLLRAQEVNAGEMTLMETLHLLKVGRRLGHVAGRNATDMWGHTDILRNLILNPYSQEATIPEFSSDTS